VLLASLCVCETKQALDISFNVQTEMAFHINNTLRIQHAQLHVNQILTLYLLMKKLIASFVCMFPRQTKSFSCLIERDNVTRTYGIVSHNGKTVRVAYTECDRFDSRRDICYYEGGVSWFSSISPCKFWDTTSIWPRLVPSSSSITLRSESL
jgi:hypothetical protein